MLVGHGIEQIRWGLSPRIAKRKDGDRDHDARRLAGPHRIGDRLELFRKPSQFGGGVSQSQPGKDGEILLNGEGWRHQPRSYLAHHGAERARHQVKVIGQKLVRVKDFDPVGSEHILRKVSQVARHDHVAASDDRRGENMTVVRVGKVECGDKRFEFGDQTVPCGPVHETARAFQGCSITVRFVAEQGVDPFPVDVGGPLCPKDIVSRQLQKDVPHRCGIENVGIKKSGEARHRAPYPMS